VRIDNGRYVDGNTINTSFTANLKVQGPLLSGATVSGQVDLGHTEILLPDKFGGPATALDVRHVNTAPGFVAPVKPTPVAAHGATGSGDLQLDLQVTNRAGISVRGFGIDAELGGALNLRGTSGEPVAVGAFSLQRGRLDLIGHRFDMNRGNLTFSGDLIPVVDFAAINTASDVVVTVLVTGRADDPQIQFTSSPSLPEEEVLSHLLFGKGLGTLSPVQAAQLLDSIAQLSGAVDRGSGFFDRVRRATGLDDLDIRQNATGGTVVGVGSRIGDNLRVGVEQDTQAGKGKVTIDLDIAKDLKARGEAGQDGSGKFGLTFEHEY
jgi:translocation and assembly module TamB